jgi:TRAP-type mannitol/chloroaromatic compound transport system permease large subunit
MNSPAMALLMFVLLALGIARSGLPVWALLVGVSSAFAALGLMLGLYDLALLGLLPTRVLGLLEHDLLQALPLYVLLGVLLQRLPMAKAVLDCTAYGLQRLGLPTPSALLVVAALFTPMNGSVASSALMLRRVLPDSQTPRASAVRAVAASLGVSIPPSLVLLLLGDAMMRAHLEAVKISPELAIRTTQMINTQTLLQAVLLPAMGLFAAWFLLSLWSNVQTNRGAAQSKHSHALMDVIESDSNIMDLEPVASPIPRPSPVQMGMALGTVGGIVLMLGGVFSGALFAVEAAATACCLLTLWALLRQSFCLADWGRIGLETAQMSGALFAILLGASTFSLVLRAWGADVWLGQTLAQTGLTPLALALCLLVATALAATVLDAFEMIIVVIPIIAPALLIALGDAQQTAVLLLFVLQLSFLLPPLGYAVLLARPAHLPMSKLVWALLPYLGVLVLVISAIFWCPRLVHYLDAPAVASAAALSEEEITKAMNAVGEQAQTQNQTQ